ncbi:MAG: histidine kinase N-terminal 7TM domain-containing protein [Thermoplasmata archaeon]
MLTWYAIPPVIAISIFAALLVCFARLRTSIHYSAFLYAFLFFLWSLGELIERSAGPPPNDMEIALLGLKIIAIAGAFLPATLVHFASEFPVHQDNVPRAGIGLLYVVSAITAFLSAGTNFLVEGLIVYEPGWGADFGVGMYVWGTYTILGTIIAIWLLEKSSFKLQSSAGRSQARIIGIALAISLCCATLTGYVPPLLGTEDIYPLTTIPFAITGVLMLHTFLKYHQLIRFSVKLPRSKKLETGYFWCTDGDYARKYFFGIAQALGSALFVTTDPNIPEEIHKSARVILLAKDGDLNPLDEDKMRMFTFLIEKFVSQEERAVVLLEGFDDLLAHYFYSTISVPDMLEEIRKCAARYNAKIICVINPDILEDWQIEEIKKGGKPLK